MKSKWSTHIISGCLSLIFTLMIMWNQMSNNGSGSALTLSEFQLMLGDMVHNQIINIIDVIP
ncbi:MAG: hypothetical protein K5695_04760 [Oscillospiraceae bacterium]|nr:hypothetical protein [Oscillospiraceae bacterium]